MARNSHQGQPQSIVRILLTNPQQALVVLHDLAQGAEPGTDLRLALETLPGALDIAGEEVLALLAGGYHLIVTSQSERALCLAGLRKISDCLNSPEASTLQQAVAAASLYQLCQQAVDAQTIGDIADLLPSLQASKPHNGSFLLADLARALEGLIPAAEALFAYERVETSQDQLSYLAAAIEPLSRAHRAARELGAADQPIIQLIAENWLSIVTGSMSDLRARAQISCQLTTRHTWQGDVITLGLRLRNEGQGAALNLRVNLSDVPDYALLHEVTLDRLVAGEESQIELQLRPQHQQKAAQFRAHFVVHYDDPHGPDQVEHYADMVHLLAPEDTFQFIPNPYVIGTPLKKGSPLFFGREDVFVFIRENLDAAHRNNLVLIGPRRTGKSSLLKQLPLHLGGDYVPVYLDGQSVALDPGLTAFFFNLATEIALALEDCGFSFEAPLVSDFDEMPAHAFERGFLRRVRKVIGDRHLVLLLDEFEELESAVLRGHLDDSIFGLLRHLIQHGEGLSLIFCGTHRMEELTASYWNVLFNISLYKHVGFLGYAEAIRLIQEPVASYGMRYDDLALDKIWRATSGHPYFLQLLCHSLVKLHNRSERSYVTVADVNQALDEILSSGEAHFAYLWTESTPEERLVLAALSRMMPLTGRVTPAQVGDYLAERGVMLDRQVISQTLHHLTLRDILLPLADSAEWEFAETYGWQMGLLGLWVEKYKSMSRMLEEIRK